MRIVRLNKDQFELEDGSIYPIEPPLEQEVSIHEFQKMYEKTLEALGSCGIIGGVNPNPEDVD